MEQVKDNGQNILHYRKPWKIRIGLALFALLLASVCPALLAIPGPKVSMNALGWFCFGLMEMICLLFSAMFLYFAGPQYLSLNLDRRTYRYVFGWPFMPQVQEGPWEDIAGVYVWNRNSGRLSGYSVCIAWQDNRASKWPAAMLGTFDGSGRLDRANRLAEKMASLLGVPLVDRPLPTRSSGTMS